MKTNLSLLGVAGLVLLISHQASQVKADDPSRVTHPIKLSIQTNTAYGPGSHGNRRDSWQVTWTFRNGTDSAWQETVRPNDVVEWHFDSKFFLYVDENASKVDWDHAPTRPARNCYGKSTRNSHAHLTRPTIALCALNLIRQAPIGWFASFFPAKR